MKVPNVIMGAGFSLVGISCFAGDLSIEGNLNVTSNLMARSVAVTNATVESLVVNGNTVLKGAIQGDGSAITNLSGANLIGNSVHSASLAPDAVTSNTIAAGSVGIDKVVLSDWNAWGDGRYLSSTGTLDLVMTPGRIVAGYGLNLSNIASTAYGAIQLGYNTGTQSVMAGSYGAAQQGYNSGTQKIVTNAYGASQRGYNTGSQTISGPAYGSSQWGSNMGTQTIISARGALQSGHNLGSQSIGMMSHGAEQHVFNSGTTVIGNFAYGTEQRGTVANGAGATNHGKGSVQLLYLTNSQTALITGHASIGMGACRVTNNQALVAGDGLASHGNGTVTAYGFYGDGSGLTGITAAQVGAYTTNQTDDAITSRLSGFNPGSCVQTNHMGNVSIQGSVSASSFTGNGAGLANLNLAAYVGSNLVWDAASNKLHAVEVSGSGYTDADAVAAVSAGHLNMSGHRVTGLADATAATDAVNLQTATNIVHTAIQQALLNVGPFGDVSMGTYTNTP